MFKNIKDNRIFPKVIFLPYQSLLQDYENMEIRRFLSLLKTHSNSFEKEFIEIL